MNWDHDILNKQSSFDNFHWVKDRQTDDHDVLVSINVNEFEKGWSINSGAYVGPGGTGNPIKNRYNDFKVFLETHDEIIAPRVNVRDNGVVDFGNGRHRYAIMRDYGLPIMVSMDPESLINAKKYGYVN